VSRPTFVLTLRPARGVDEIKALRRALKYLLRAGLRCTSVRELPSNNNQTIRRRDARRRTVRSTSVPKETNIMVSARKYGFANRYIKLEDLHGGPPLRECIGLTQVNTSGKYGDRLELTFEPSGKKLSLNKSSVEALIEAFGEETNNWLGRFVEVYAGEIETKDGMQDAVLVRGVPDVPADAGIAAKAAKAAAKARKASNSFDDDVPY
jgi:hypothetical protein